MNPETIAVKLLEDINEGYTVFTDECVDYFLQKCSGIELLERFIKGENNFNESELVILHSLLRFNEYPNSAQYSEMSLKEQEEILNCPEYTGDKTAVVFDNIGALIQNFPCAVDPTAKDNCYLAKYVHKVRGKWVLEL